MSKEPILSIERVLQQVEQITAIIDRALTQDNRERIFGAEIMPFFESDAGRKVPPQSLVRLALLSDCLRVVDMALRAGGMLDLDDLHFLQPLVFPAARFYAQLRSDYRPFYQLDASEQHFLDHVRYDRELFGHACEATRWLGLDICRRVAQATHDTEINDIYERMILEIMDEIIAVDGISQTEAHQRARLKEFIELRKKMEERAPASAEDPRIRAFCHGQAPDVFSATEYAHQVWDHDPFDVEWVHAEARSVFERLVDRVTTRPGTPGPNDHGAILLVLGESGSGKTHLMRAFRNYVHGQALGYVGYMQMSTREPDYATHILERLIDSLERPYHPQFPETTGLSRFANAVAEAPSGVSRQALARLREDDFDTKGALHEHVRQIADAILATPGYDDFDPDLLRALLYLQRRDPISRSRVLKYLRSRPMSGRDLADIGDLGPPPPPMRMIEQLGRLMWVNEQVALCLLVDQLEELTHHDDAPARFRDILTAVRHIIDYLPSSIVVISCIENAYVMVKEHLTRSLLDRLERDPAPVSLSDRRSLDEIEAIVSRRLAYLYDTLDIRRGDDEIFPFRRADLTALANFRTRDVLDFCQQYRERCIEAGRLVDPQPAKHTAVPPSAQNDPILLLEQAWDDLRVGRTDDPPDTDAALIELLARAAHACAAELEPGCEITAAMDGEFLLIRAPDDEGKPDELLVGMTNKDARGGRLSEQIQAVRVRALQKPGMAGPRRPVIVRCAPFPDNPKTQVVQTIAALLSAGGRRVVVEDSEWRIMQAFSEFAARHGKGAGFPAWCRKTRPLSRLNALRVLLGLGDRRQPAPPPDSSTSGPGAAASPARSVTPEPPEQEPGPQAAQPKATQPPAARPGQRPRAAGRPAGPLHLGKAASLLAEPLGLDMNSLTRHAAFLGSTGSGKTTLALHLVEELLVRGIPVVLVDRKGDLAGYAQSSFWHDMPADPEQKSRKQALRDAVEVALYTPGDPRGRPLSIPVIPTGMAELPSHERSKIARYAASALAAMINYKDSPSDRARMAILAQAIETLAQASTDEEPSLGRLTALVDDEDPALVNAIGKLDTKHFSKLVEHLETLRLTRGELLDQSEALLDPEELFGRKTTGKTRLGVISTKFLGDNANILFWISRFLIEVARWASKRPSDVLQAVLFFDEADLYLPAQSKPPTKEPMQDLLKRARSAGLGMLLASQSPGDLDYRCRDNIGTWFLGRISEERAIGKMKPLLGEYRGNIAKKLPGQRVGEFLMLQAGHVTQFKAERSLLETRQLPEESILDLARATMDA